MTLVEKKEIMYNIRTTMNPVEIDEIRGYEIYEEELTGTFFEIDFTDDWHVYEVDEDFEIIDILF